MPKGQLLWVELALYSYQIDRKNFLNEIRMTLFEQMKTFDLGVFYHHNLNFSDTWINFKADNNLYDFNVYSVEWNETTIIWKFNSKEIMSTKLEMFLPDLNDMDIYINLGVGGKRFDTKYIYLDEIRLSNTSRRLCPVLPIG